MKIMNKETVQTIAVLGGGFLLFLLLRPRKNSLATTSAKTVSASGKKPSIGSKKITEEDTENAVIVLNAYCEAYDNQESQETLNMLNKQCIEDYGLRCYRNVDGKFVVCNVEGVEIIESE